VKSVGLMYVLLSKQLELLRLPWLHAERRIWVAPVAPEQQATVRAAAAVGDQVVSPPLKVEVRLDQGLAGRAPLRNGRPRIQ
jgi:hypothetical protein